MVLFCFVGPGRLPHQPDQHPGGPRSTRRRTRRPARQHLLGTDQSGFDILGRIMYGGQISLEVGLRRGSDRHRRRRALRRDLRLLRRLGRRADDAHRRRAALGPDPLPGDRPGGDLPPVARDPDPRDRLRGVARPRPGSSAARRCRCACASTCRPSGSWAAAATRIVLRHIIPNTIGTIIVNATFQVADAILLLAALGFIGLGVPAPLTDWGSMLADGVELRARRLLVADLPGRGRDRARRRRVQLRRRRAARRVRGAAAAPLAACRQPLIGPAADSATGRLQREVAGGQVAARRTAAAAAPPRRRSSWASGQRVRKRQPDGGVIAEGSSPRTRHRPSRARAATGSGIGDRVDQPARVRVRRLARRRPRPARSRRACRGT